MDGDGWPDVAIALPRPSLSAAGLVRVYSGRDLSLLDEHVGDWHNDLFGTGLAAAGDLDGDGGDELLVGAPFSGGTNRPGYAKALSHRPISRTPILTVEGVLEYEYLGRDVAAGADLSGDGVPDLVLGGRGVAVVDKHLGIVRAISGADGSLLWSQDGPNLSSGYSYGNELAVIGDVNGDGVADVATNVLDPMDDVHVLSGVDGALIRAINGQGLLAYGATLAPAGDHDGDGVPDLLIGTGIYSGQGTVQVHSGSTGAPLVTMTGPTAIHTHFGLEGLCALGDVTGDGVSDYAVGDTYYDLPDAEGGSGTLFLFSGSDGSQLLAVPGPRFLDRFGLVCLPVSDQDGDGFPDVATWSHGQANFGGIEPQLRIHSSADGAVLATYQPAGASGGNSADVVSLGDLDADGGADVACLIAGVDAGGQYNNRIDVVALDQEALRFSIAGPTPASFNSQPPIGFGGVLAATGDLDGDGVTELLVGASIAGPERQGKGYVLVSRDLTWQGVGPGNALPGAFNTPALRIEGELLGGDPLELTVGGGPADAIAYVVVGLTAWALPFKGGVLVPTDDLVLPLGLDGAGAGSLLMLWPEGLPGAVPLYVQAWIADPAGPRGYAATNALVGTTP